MGLMSRTVIYGELSYAVTTKMCSAVGEKKYTHLEWGIM